MRLARFAAFVLVAVLAASTLARPAVAQPAPMPSIEDFFRNPAFFDAKLSPDGKRLGVIVGATGKRKQLAVLDLDARDKVRTVASLSNADVGNFRWVNDRRLVFTIVDLAAGAGEQYVTGIYAVDADGAEMRQLAGVRDPGLRVNIKDRTLDWRTRLRATVDDGSDDIVVSQRFDEEFLGVLRLNTRTGIATRMAQTGPKGAYDWVLDTKGQPRYVVADWDGTTTLSVWDAARRAWGEVARWPSYGGFAITPAHMDFNDDLYVMANPDGFDALYRFDPQAKRLQPDPLVRIDGFDFDGFAEFDHGARKVLGVHFTTDAPTSHWFDPAMKAAQSRIDALLPGTSNRISCGRCLSNPFLLVFARSDREPGTYYLYEAATGKVERLFRQRPWLDTRSMGRRDFVRVPSRDGKRIPTWLTLPPDFKKGAPRPAVVLVHGGPWSRGGSWVWSDEAQFLATRGFVVIEPEYRGSAGFGKDWYEAGFKQWGLAMQDDVADATRWAAANGYAQPGRVCIVGTNYGGYSALMGLARDGDLYRCGVTMAGVTDLDLLYTSAQTDFTEQALKFGMPMRVGDRKKDAEQLRNTSPVYLADRINRPLMLAYGGEDRRVPVEQGRRFYNAIVKTNAQVEWILYPDEGQRWLLESNRFDFYARLEKFLARHLKSAAD